MRSRTTPSSTTCGRSARGLLGLQLAQLLAPALGERQPVHAARDELLPVDVAGQAAVDAGRRDPRPLGDLVRRRRAVADGPQDRRLVAARRPPPRRSGGGLQRLEVVVDLAQLLERALDLALELRAAGAQLLDRLAEDRAGHRARNLQRLPSRIAVVELVPELDVGLAVDPAQVDLATLADRREVDEATVEVTQHDLALVEAHRGRPQGQERLADLAPRPPASVGRRAREQRLARLAVGQPRTGGAHDGQPVGDPRKLRTGLLERVVAGVAHGRILLTARAGGSPRARRGSP